MTTTVTEPRTRAGKLLAEGLADCDAGHPTATQRIAVIEEEASNRQLLAYLWTATGKDGATRVCDLFNEDDPLAEDVRKALG